MSVCEGEPVVLEAEHIFGRQRWHLDSRTPKISRLTRPLAVTIWSPHEIPGTGGVTMADVLDPRWASLLGGYRQACDPRPIIDRITDPASRQAGWDDAWNELHHQGGVGGAAYGAVVLLVERAAADTRLGREFFSFVACVEECRSYHRNEPLPAWLERDYAAAWRAILPLALNALATTDDELEVRTALSIVAMAKGQLKLGVLLAEIELTDVDEWIEDRLAWSEVVRR